MARPRSEQKRNAILRSAVEQIAAAGLSASTASIAKGANLAEGTLFTYFPTKSDLFNHLYLELKGSVYRRINENFPHEAELRDRAEHIWSESLRWILERPEERNVSQLLNLSGLVTDATKRLIHEESQPVTQAMQELSLRGAFRGLPSVFASSVVSAMQDAVVVTVAQRPRERAKLIRRSFEAFWLMAE